MCYQSSIGRFHLVCFGASSEHDDASAEMHWNWRWSTSRGSNIRRGSCKMCPSPREERAWNLRGCVVVRRCSAENQVKVSGASTCSIFSASAVCFGYDPDRVTRTTEHLQRSMVTEHGDGACMPKSTSMGGGAEECRGSREQSNSPQESKVAGDK
jgi:hypothetical protein